MTNKKEEVEKYSAVTIIQSDKYKEYADLLDAVLDEGVDYTIADIEQILQKALVKKVEVKRN